MKKNIISLAVAATVLGAAAAQAGQYVNPDKTGQVLLFPFYNADNGNATNMHIVNTTSVVKAVKIRFVEYKNSDEVLDFNLYLSPKDHFAFGVIKDPNGTGAAVITADNSCTVPQLGSPNGAFSGTITENADGSKTRVQPFVNYQYAKDVDATIERTLTGHVEVIEMGVVNNVGTTKTAQHKTFATHGATGVPVSCAGLDASWASGAWAANPSEEIYAPTGGMYGVSYHINVESAAAYGFEPTAIDQWAVGANHTNPGRLFPSIAAGGVADAALKHGLGGDQHIERTFNSGVEATTAILQTTSVSNDVMVNPAIGGMTDWVVSFPTKRAHVDKGTKAAVVPPFTGNWLGSTGTTTKKEQAACETVTIGQWDREEAYTANENGFSPSPEATSTSICNEVAVFAMGAAATSAMNVETGLKNLSFPYSEGWQQIGFGQNMTDALGVVSVKGLPAVGFAAYKVSNGAMSYGNAAEHKTNAVVSGGAGYEVLPE